MVFRSIKLRAAEVVKDNLKPFAGAGIMMILLILIKPFFSETMISTVLFGFIGIVVYFSMMCLLKDEFVQVIRRQVLGLLEGIKRKFFHS